MTQSIRPCENSVIRPIASATGGNWSTAWRALDWSDVAQGLTKPLAFAVVIALIGCFYGLRASGGTQGVGRATTQAMVAATVLIFLLDLMITKLFVWGAG